MNPVCPKSISNSRVFRKINKTSKYDEEMPQSQITDQPEGPRVRVTEHKHQHNSKNTNKVKQ